MVKVLGMDLHICSWALEELSSNAIFFRPLRLPTMSWMSWVQLWHRLGIWCPEEQEENPCWGDCGSIRAGCKELWRAKGWPGTQHTAPPPQRSAYQDSWTAWVLSLATPSSQYYCLFITAFFSVKANPFFSLITHFFSHSDLTGGEEACANIELPIEINGDTLNCLLTFAFDKKRCSTICSLSAAGLLPSRGNTYLPEWKFCGSRGCIFSTSVLCANMLPSSAVSNLRSVPAARQAYSLQQFPNTSLRKEKQIFL